LAKIELNIVALGDFSSVNQQIKALQLQIEALNKGVSGVGLGQQLTKDLNSAQAAFKSTMLSTGQFTMQTVKMASETEKFGQSLVSGKLKLSEYFNIITNKAGAATASMNALAESQVKLQNSVVVKNNQGFLDVYTPTSFNKVAQAEELVTMKAALMQKAIEGGSTALINFGKNTQWAGRQLTVGLTMPMVMFGAAAVKSFKDTNTELTRLQRLYGEGLTPPSQAQLDQISSQVLNLGTQVAQDMGIAQSETVKVAANFAAMGRQGKDLLDTTYQTQRLSKLGAVDATAATNTIVSLQNVYKVSTNDLANAVNFLSDIQKQTTMTLGDMTEAIPRVGPIMQQLGGTYKDTAVMLVAMREAGVPAAQAANALKSAMASIIAPTKGATAEAQQFGISLDAIKNAGSPVQMIEKLQAGLAGLTSLAKEQVIEKIFGKFQFARISALLENFGKVGSQTVNAIRIAGATSGQLATLANQEMKQATSSVSSQWTRAIEGFKATLYPIGQKFVEMGAIVLNVANKIGKAFSSLPSPLKGFFGFLLIGAALAGPLIMLTGLLSNFAGYILKTVGNINKLAHGGMTLKELLTPEIVASQKAAELFSNQISNDVNAVDLLSQAIQRLTVSLEGMSGAMNTGTADIALSSAAAIAEANAGIGETLATRKGIQSVITKEEAALWYGSNQKTGTHTTQNPTSGAYVTRNAGEDINGALAKGGIESSKYISAMTALTGETENAAKMFRTTYTDYLGVITQLKNVEGKQLITQENADKILAQINSEYQAELLEMQRLYVLTGKQEYLLTDINNPLAQIAQKVIKMNAELSANPALFTQAFNDFNVASSKNRRLGPGQSGGGNVIPISAGEFGNTSLKLEGKASEGSMLLHSYNEEFLAFKDKFIADMRAAAKESGIVFDETFIAEANKTFDSTLALVGETAAENIITPMQAKISQMIPTLVETTSSKLTAESSMFALPGFEAGQVYQSSMQQKIESMFPSMMQSEAEILTAESSMFALPGEAAGTSWAEGFMSRAKGAGSAIGSVVGKVGNVGKGGAMGIALGGTILGQSLSENKNSAISSAGTGITAGSNAMMIASMMGPEVAAMAGPIGIGVAAAAVGIKLLINQMNDVKAHNEAIASSFKANGDAITAYGGNMLSATQATYNFNTGTQQTSKVLSQTAQDVANIAKLKSTDALKQIGDLLKGGTTASGVIGTVEQFAAAQVANGMDPSKVSQMVTDLLTYSGQTQYLGQALKEITKNTQDVATATETWMHKLTTATGYLPIATTDYQSLNTQQQSYADALLSTSNIISDSSTPMSVVISKLQAMGTSGNNTISAINALAAALGNVNVSASQAVTQLASLDASLPQILEVLRLNNLGVDTSLITNAKSTGAMDQALGTLVKQNIDSTAANAVKAASDQVKSAQKAISDAAVQTSATTGLNAQEKITLTTDNARKKALEAQLAVMKLQTSELKAQQQYNLSQADLDNQIRLAQASGDFLQANLLQQQKSSNTSQYNNDNAQQALQQKIDDLTTAIDGLNQKVATAKTVASTQSQTNDLNQALVLAKANLATIVKANTGPGLAGQEKSSLAALGLAATGAKDNPLYVAVTSSSGVVGSAGNPISGASNVSSSQLISEMKGSSKVFNDKGVLSSNPGVGAEDPKTALILLLGLKKGQYVTYTNPVLPKNSDKTEGQEKYYYDGNNLIDMGPVPKHAFGGLISGPGSWTSDSIPSYLSNGEFVTKAASVAKYGTSFMNSINNGTFNPKFPTVGAPNIPAATGAGIGGAVYNITVNAQTSANTDEIVKAVTDSIKRMDSMTSTNRRIKV
jgi:TP901 family phage tail tape measure protein